MKSRGKVKRMASIAVTQFVVTVVVGEESEVMLDNTVICSSHNQAFGWWDAKRMVAVGKGEQVSGHYCCLYGN